MVNRIIDKQTKLFIRDDFTFDEETEYALDVAPAQGFCQPKWNGTEWVEGLSEEEIAERKAQTAPDLSERDLIMLAIADLDAQREKDKTDNQIAMAELAETILGGLF